MTKRAAIVLAAIPLVAALIGLGPTAGADTTAPPGLAFADAGPVALTWSELQGGASVTLCNTTALLVTPHLVVTGPEVTVAGSPRPVADLVTPSPTTAALAAGSCAAIGLGLTGAGASDVAAGAASAVQLTAVAAGAGTASLALSVSSASAPQLQGSFGDVTLSATRGAPWSSTATLDDPSLWLRYTGGTPAPVGALSVPVVDGDQRGTLEVKPDQVSADGALRLPLAISGVSEPGTYHGALELGGEHGSIPFALVVADAPWVLFVLVLFGVVLAVLLRKATGSWRYRIRLMQSRRSLGDDYRDAFAALPDELRERFPAPDRLVLAAWQDRAKASAKAYFRTVFTIDLADPAYVALRTEVAEVRADVECVQHQLAEALGALQDALSRLGTFLDTALPSMADPDIVDSARALLRLGAGGADHGAPALQLKEATRIAAEAGTLTAALTAWQAEADLVVRHLLWSHRLAWGAEFPDQLQLSAADDALGRVIRELFDATSSAGVTAVAHSADARQAHQLLATVGARRNLWIDDDRDDGLLSRADGLVGDRVPERLALPHLREQARVDRWSAADRVVATFELVEQRLPVVAGAVAAWVMALAGAVVSFAVASFLAYQSLYAGKPFGGWPDYLGALFAGVAAGTVVDALVNGLNWTKGGLRSLTS